MSHTANATILVDDCHTLTFAALEYIIYLSVETNTPLVLVGNPRVLEKLRPEPQLFSRVFLKQEGTLPAGKALHDAVEAVLGREAPDHIPALRTMAREVAAQPGHLRGLIQRCRAMHELMGQFSEYAGNAAAAFHAAHALSVHSGYTPSFNIRCVERAKALGKTLRPGHGVIDQDGTVHSATEEDIFTALEWDFIPPESRL